LKKHILTYTNEVNKNIIFTVFVGLGSWLIVSNITALLNVNNPITGILFGVSLTMIGVYFKLKDGTKQKKKD